MIKISSYTFYPVNLKIVLNLNLRNFKFTEKCRIVSAELYLANENISVKYVRV